MEEEVTLPNGEKLIQLSFKEPLYDEFSKLIGILGYTVDITDKKAAEEREKLALVESSKAKAKADAEEQLRQAIMILTGSIAHDLRTPISIIAMEADILKKYLPCLLNMYNTVNTLNISIEVDNIPDRIRPRLFSVDDRLQKTVQEMRDFIDTTLKTLSKVVSGNLMESDLVICSMWHCIHNTLLRYPFSSQQRELITWDQADFKFMANPVLMIRIFFNLIKNSLEQIEKNKGGKIYIRTEIKNDTNLIYFKDTAGGASPEVVDKLFSGFCTTKEGGTGIGLAFCKLTIENFGGNITCHSDHGKYIEFTLSFPVISES
jgi:two-component system, CAI-1 autoinducer sensor kinase/phosphatase CqsS